MLITTPSFLLVRHTECRQLNLSCHICHSLSTRSVSVAYSVVASSHVKGVSYKNVVIVEGILPYCLERMELVEIPLLCWPRLKCAMKRNGVVKER